MAIDRISMELIQKEFRKRLKKKVKLRVLLGKNCIICKDLEKFIRDIAEISENKISYELVNNADEYPVLWIGKNIKYMGMPTGNITGMFLQFLMDVSSNTYFADKDTLREVKKLEDVLIEAYIATFCRNSPQQVRWAFEFSAINPKIKSVIIDINQFPQLATKNAIKFTPTTTINKKVNFIGACAPDELLRKIKLAIY